MHSVMAPWRSPLDFGAHPVVGYDRTRVGVRVRIVAMIRVMVMDMVRVRVVIRDRSRDTIRGDRPGWMYL